MNPNNLVQPLQDRFAKYIRASSVIPSFKSFVEELVLNSLDAKAKKIQINIDSNKLQLEVIDNGHGMIIDEFTMSDWNRTSKQISSGEEASYGCRGEALNAMAYLSCMHIKSRLSKSPYTFSKLCDSWRTPAVVVNKTTGGHYGTTVSVKDIFHNIEVRRKTIKIHDEINKVKRFVERMSLLHHSVAWTLTDTSSKRILFSVVPHRSVAARFTFLHSPRLFCNMVEVDFSEGNCRIVGFISKPTSACCHPNSMLQYFYVNNRWVETSNFLVKIIDSAFVGALATNKGGGPEAKHYEPNGFKVASHPLFVLQFICPDIEYDCMSEPDKSYFIFRDALVPKLCIKKLLLNLFRDFNDNCFPSLVRQLAANDTQEYGIKSISNARISATDDSILFGSTNLSVAKSPSTSSLISECSPVISRTPQSDIFRSAFLPSSSPLSSPCEQSRADREGSFNLPIYDYNDINYRENLSSRKRDALTWDGDNEQESSQESPPSYVQSISVTAKRNSSSLQYYDRKLCDQYNSNVIVDEGRARDINRDHGMYSYNDNNCNDYHRVVNNGYSYEDNGGGTCDGGYLRVGFSVPDGNLKNRNGNSIFAEYLNLDADESMPDSRFLDSYSDSPYDSNNRKYDESLVSRATYTNDDSCGDSHGIERDLERDRHDEFTINSIVSSIGSTENVTADVHSIQISVQNDGILKSVNEFQNDIQNDDILQTRNLYNHPSSFLRLSKAHSHSQYGSPTSTKVVSCLW